MEQETDQRSYTGRIANFELLRKPPFNIKSGDKVLVYVEQSNASEFAVLSLEDKEDEAKVTMVPHSLVIMNSQKKRFLINQLKDKS